MDIFAKMRTGRLDAEPAPKPQPKRPANIWATMGAGVAVHASTSRPRSVITSSSSQPSTVLPPSSTHPSTVTDPGSEDEDMLDGEKGIDGGQEEEDDEEEEEEDDDHTRSSMADEVTDGNFHQSRQSPTFNQANPPRLSDRWDQAFVQNNPEEARIVSIEIFNLHIMHLRWTYRCLLAHYNHCVQIRNAIYRQAATLERAIFARNMTETLRRRPVHERWQATERQQ
ncbi:hypothetical protein FA13DRAFT_1797722 [Coprinellus micaceus]|uniref:Uncharacterized protein n=1 Tax=Coprinellus micaceus TaxID=71717 RepID=A0A4Y7SQ69_COPMI|nr:hypothetical protein FA13DRAFT_1797722 [Coprinellus micaceus]